METGQSYTLRYLTEEIEMGVYEDHGYADRDDYLQCLSEDTGYDLNTVKAVAELLGPSEDFDGLVNALQEIT